MDPLSPGGLSAESKALGIAMLGTDAFSIAEAMLPLLHRL